MTGLSNLQQAATVGLGLVLIVLPSYVPLDPATKATLTAVGVAFVAGKEILGGKPAEPAPTA